MYSQESNLVDLIDRPKNRSISKYKYLRDLCTTLIERNSPKYC